jgi:hypothetical protein
MEDVCRVLPWDVEHPLERFDIVYGAQVPFVGPVRQLEKDGVDAGVNIYLIYMDAVSFWCSR